MEKVRRSPDEHIQSLDGNVREGMQVLDATISAALPGRERVLWEGVFWGGTEQSIIGYRDILQRRGRGNDVEWFLIGLARQKDYYSVYVNAAEDGEYLSRAYADRLGKVKVGSASIAIRNVDDIDLDVLTELVQHADRIS